VRALRVAVLASPSFRAMHRLDEAHGIERVEKIADAGVLLVTPRFGSVIRDQWPDVKRVRWIHALGAGVETFPFDLLRGSGIVLTNSRGVYAGALAEFVVGAMLWFAKDFRRLVTNQAAHRWEPFAVERIEGATAGIIGYGGIGRAVAKRAEALGMRVIATRATSIDDIVANADYVVLAVPLTHETRGLMNAERIARLKGVLINVSRGAVVDEEALVDALRTHRIRGAALDVFAVEPLPPDHPLWSLDNALISPHTADHTSDSHDRAMDLFLRNVERFRRGEALENVVDLEREY